MHAPADIVSPGDTILINDCVTRPGVELHGNTGLGAVFSGAAVADTGIHGATTGSKIKTGRLESLSSGIAARPAPEVSLLAPIDDRIVSRIKSSLATAASVTDAESVRGTSVVSDSVANAHVCVDSEALKRQGDDRLIGVGEVVQGEKHPEVLVIGRRGDFQEPIGIGAAGAVVSVPGIVLIGTVDDESLKGRIAVRRVEVVEVVTCGGGQCPAGGQRHQTKTGQEISWGTLPSPNRRGASGMRYLGDDF